MPRDEFDVQSILNLLTQNLKVLTETQRVVGDPIEVGSVTIIPLVMIQFGYGGGGGGGAGTNSSSLRLMPVGRGSGAGEGGGAGGNLQPIGLLVIDKDEVRVFTLPVSGPYGTLDKPAPGGRVLELVPDLIAKLKDAVDKKKKS